MENNGTMFDTIPSFATRMAEGEQVLRETEERQRAQGQMTAEQLRMQMEMQAAFEYDDDRHMVEMLQESEKTFGDSKLMKEVKTGLAEVEENLQRLGAQDFTDQYFEDVTRTYFNAISACSRYLNDRGSGSKQANERRMLVQRNHNRLIREVEMLGRVRELFFAGIITDNDDAYLDLSLKDMFLRARVYDLGTKPEKRSVPKTVTREITDPGLLKLKSLMSAPEKKITDKKKAAAIGRDLGLLRRALKEIPEGRAWSTYVEVMGSQFLITQDEAGVVTVTSGTSTAVLKENISDMLRLVDSRMIEESGMISESDLDEMIRDQKDYELVFGIEGWIGEKTAGDIQRAGTRLARFLELRTGRPATFFSNIDVSHLRQLALMIVHGTNVQDIIDVIEENEKRHELEKSNVNTNETLSLVRQIEGRDDLDEKVIFPEAQTEQLEDGWEADERATRDLVADLIFSQDTWEADESVTTPGERMRRMLYNHRHTIAHIIVDQYREDRDGDSVIDRVLDKLPLKMAGIEGDALKKEIRQQILSLDSMIDHGIEHYPEKLKEYLDDFSDDIDETKEEVKKEKLLVTHNEEAMVELLEQTLTPDNILHDVVLRSQLEKYENRIDTIVDNFSEKIQEKINSSINVVFGGAGNDDETEIIDFIPKDPEEEGISAAEKQKRIDENEAHGFFNLKDPQEKNIDAAEKEKRIKTGERALKYTLVSSMQGESGQGKFTKIVFENYFKSVNRLDKRSMLGSAIRSATPDATEGQFLGGLLKGAGPLFQKMMQGLPVDGFPEDIRIALDDMKSKLAPIPDRIVKAQLLGMVERSGGRISNIEVTRALGAASVGQTFLCKMYGPTLPADGKDIVVKLLKPDVRNRMMREKSVMLKCAELTDDTGGMKATYLGQLSRIEEELDLTIEARNVVKGEIYDKQREGELPDGVSSMKLNDLVEATVNSMVLEKAPGTTVDRYFKDIKAMCDQIRESLNRRDDEQLPKTVMKPGEFVRTQQGEEEFQKRMEAYKDYLRKYTAANDRYRARINAIRPQIVEEVKKACKRQKYLTALADKWVSEGIFGEGFYHGDLHAGNIMINDEGATLIDFGNATTLSEDQQVQVTRMVGASAVGDVDGFKEGLHRLLKPEFDGQFKRQEKKLTRELKKIFALGNKNSAGIRIAVALLKAQELGLEVPSAIFNFSQCQLRLQNAIDDMNSSISGIEQLLSDLDHANGVCPVEDGNLYDLTLYHMGSVWKAHETGKDVVKRQYTEVLGPLFDAFEAEEFEVSRKQVEDGKVYEMYRKYEKDGQKILEVEHQQLSKELNQCFKNLQNDRKAYVLNSNARSAMAKAIDTHMKAYSAFLDGDEIRKEILNYIDNVVAKREGTMEFPTEADREWMASLDAKLNRVSDSIYKLLTSCRALEKAKSEKKKAEEIKLAVDEVIKDYMPLHVMNKLNGELLPLQSFRWQLTGREHRAKVDNMIPVMASYDTELGEKLKSQYEVFKEYEAKHPGYSMHNTPQLDDLLITAGKITARKLRPYFEDLKQMHDNPPQTFVDVMGDTIVRNLTVSLKRLGLMTSYKYGNALGDEEE